MFFLYSISLQFFFHSCFFGLFVTSLYSSIDRHTHKQILRSISKTVWGAYLQHHLFWASILQVPFHWKCCYLPKHFAIVDVPTPNANTLAVCSDEQEFICLCINFPLGKYPTNQTKPNQRKQTVTWCIYYILQMYIGPESGWSSQFVLRKLNIYTKWTQQIGVGSSQRWLPGQS